jgi:cellulose synthase/poly-beta-1,6-N-acetylglucosamine synthase-like glycosyltransferase
LGVDPALTPTQNGLIVVYFTLWSLFALLGLRRFWLLWLYRKGRRRDFPRRDPVDPPRVTVQLPIYNERYVVKRLLRAVAALDYPRDRLEIQVLDDSTDATVEAAEAEVARLRAEGVDIAHVRRDGREGYKAGALAYGLEQAKGDFLLILDADFVPRPGLLREMLPYFSDPGIGMVQVRWEHLNADYSLLAKVQAISLDGHFVVEHEARAKNGLLWNFNGTAGMWRRACIEEAGGWEHDTLTEDMDLSYRAQLKGWRFAYLRDVTCPSELPVDMRSFKGQQFRWVKGSVQVAKKILPRVWRADLPLADKLELSVHLTQNTAYLFILLLSIFVYPAVLIRFASGWFSTWPVETLLFVLATVSVFFFYGAAVAGVRRDWKRQIGYLPAVMSVTIGLSVNNTRAILEGLIGKHSPFHRTPKFAISGRRGTWKDKAYRGLRSGTAAVELLLGLYFAGILVFTLRHGLFGAAPFVVLFLFGYLYVALLSLDLVVPRWRAAPSASSSGSDA